MSCPPPLSSRTPFREGIFFYVEMVMPAFADMTK